MVVGTDGSTDDDDKSGLPVTPLKIGDIKELDVHTVDEKPLDLVYDDLETEDVVLHMLDDDKVVNGTLEEVPLVVSVIPKVDDERVLYDVENVLSDSDTVVGVTVGTFDKLSVDDAVELKSSPATVSNPVKEAVDIEVSRLLDKDDEIEELSPTTLLLADDVP